MGFRFRKRVKILPGVSVNLSKSGASVSVGGPGATTNISKRGVKSTVGVPGTGLSYSTTNAAPRKRAQQNAQPRQEPASSGRLKPIELILIGAGVVALVAYVLSQIA